MISCTVHNVIFSILLLKLTHTLSCESKIVTFSDCSSCRNPTCPAIYIPDLHYARQIIVSGDWRYRRPITNSSRPLLVSEDIRDIWKNPSGLLRHKVRAIEKSLKTQINFFVDWVFLRLLFEGRFRDKQEFIPSITEVAYAWLKAFRDHLDYEEWAENFERLWDCPNDTVLRIQIKSSPGQ